MRELKKITGGFALGDINIGNGATVITNSKGTFEIRILSVSGADPENQAMKIIGFDHGCFLNIHSLEVKLNPYAISNNLGLQQVLASFKPIIRIEHPLTNSFVEECLENAKTEVQLTRQSAVEYLTHLSEDLKVFEQAINTLLRAYIARNKQHLQSVPEAGSATLKDLANKLLNILEEKEKSI